MTHALQNQITLTKKDLDHHLHTYIYEHCFFLSGWPLFLSLSLSLSLFPVPCSLFSFARFAFFRFFFAPFVNEGWQQ